MSAHEPIRDEAQRRPMTPILAATAVALLLLLGVGGAKSIRDLRAAQDRADGLDAEIESTEERIVLLQERIERIRNDPAELERLAREELRWVKPGDRVIYLPKPEEGAANPSFGGTP